MNLHQIIHIKSFYILRAISKIKKWILYYLPENTLKGISQISVKEDWKELTLGTAFFPMNPTPFKAATG